MTETKICECGLEVSGKDKKTLESNLRTHKKSKLHKRLMKNKNLIIKKDGDKDDIRERSKVKDSKKNPIPSLQLDKKRAGRKDGLKIRPSSSSPNNDNSKTKRGFK